MSLSAWPTSRCLVQTLRAEEEHAFGGEPWEDEWHLEPDGRLVRVHRALRQKLFTPLSSTAPPCDYASILGRRITGMVLGLVVVVSVDFPHLLLWLQLVLPLVLVVHEDSPEHAARPETSHVTIGMVNGRVVRCC